MAHSCICDSILYWGISVYSVVKAEERRRLTSCEQAMKKGSLDQTAMHCVFIGIPHSGKSSLIQRLLGKRPSVISASTGVAERVVEETIKIRTPAIVGRSYTETKPRRYGVMPLKGRWGPLYPATEKWSSIINPRLR